VPKPCRILQTGLISHLSPPSRLGRLAVILDFLFFTCAPTISVWGLRLTALALGLVATLDEPDSLDALGD
jgi:hypothetical protein